MRHFVIGILAIFVKLTHLCENDTFWQKMAFHYILQNPKEMVPEGRFRES